MESRHATESPEHASQMASEHSAIRVQFIADDVAQVLEEPHPLCMVRKDSGVQYVRIRQDDVPALWNRFSAVTGCVAVICEYSKTVVEAFRKILQLGQLILGKHLGWKQMEGTSIGILQHRIENPRLEARSCTLIRR
jgi:hypothetical protein